MTADGTRSRTKTARCVQRSQSAAAGRQDFFLGPLHPSRPGLRLIVEAMQMQKAMGDIERKLARERSPKRASMALRCFNADKNLTMLKRKDIGWTRLVHEFAM